MENDIYGSGAKISVGIALSKHNWSGHYKFSTIFILVISVVGAFLFPASIVALFKACGGMNAVDIKSFRFNDRMLLKNSLAS